MFKRLTAFIRENDQHFVDEVMTSRKSVESAVVSALLFGMGFMTVFFGMLFIAETTVMHTWVCFCRGIAITILGSVALAMSLVISAKYVGK